MTKVIMKTLYAGPAGTCHPNGEIDLDEKEAAGLVAGGYAEHAAPKAAKKPEKRAEKAETAAAAPAPETAENAPLAQKKGGFK